MDYKYNQRAGALNDAAIVASPRQRAPMSQTTAAPGTAGLFDDDYVSQHATAVRGLAVAEVPMHAQSLKARTQLRHALARHTGQDPINVRGGGGMFFHTIVDGQRVRVIERDGHVRIVAGPKRLLRFGRRVEPMEHYVAHPGEFLIVRFRDGRQEHLAGPCDLWFDPRVHASVEKEDALQIASKEAVVVYSRHVEDDTVLRRVVYGPAVFVPEPGEWLHTFSWHGSRGGEAGYQKVPNALVFQKLWFLPDQMYHDVEGVRTADGAVLTIRLMLFFELVDVETMLATTHDPIGDFVNATTSDVVELTSRHDFESFKKSSDRLNDLATYQQLVSRAAQCGYRIDKVVYRGYGAPESLQRMHDESIESRTRLMLERAMQEQAQDLEDFKLGREHARATSHRTERAASLAHELEQKRLEREASLRDAGARRAFARAEASMDAEQRASIASACNEAKRTHLAGLKDLGVDLTAFLTQSRADRVIELRGATHDAHLHLDGRDADEPPRRNGESH